MNIKHLSTALAALLLTANTHASTATQLEPIEIISASKTTQSITNTTSNVTVITAEDIEENGYQTVAQAINTVAGISVAHSGGLGQQTSFFVRGADSGKVLVLLDGMRLNDPSTPNGTALLDSLSTSSIQQIEIIKGGASSIWGSNASAGVINIITKEATEGIHGSFAATYGSYATKGADVQLSYKDEKFIAQVLTSYLETDGFSALSPRSAEEDGYENKNSNLKFGYAFDENNRLNLSYNRIKTETEFDDSYSTTQAYDDYSHAASDQRNIALNYQLTQDNYSAAFNASQGDYDRDYYTTGLYGDSQNVYKSTLKEYSWTNALDYISGKAILGLEYKNIDGFNQYNTYPQSQSDYTNKAIFLSNTYKVTPTTLIETNLRYDHYTEFENKTTYKIGAKHDYPSMPGFTTSANYYTAYDAPSAYQLANQLPTFNLLKPAYTKGYDISAGYKELFSISYFNTKVEDGIDYIGVWPNAGYDNIDGTQKFSGIELQSSYKLPSLNLNLSANYTHLFTYEKEDETDLIRRAKNTFNTSADYYIDNNTHFGVTAHYVGDRIDSDGGWPASNVATGNYTLWNLNFGTKIRDDIDLSIHARNIFDKDYQSVYGYATEGQSIYAKIKYSF